MTSDDRAPSRDEQLARLLVTPPPREVPEMLRRSAVAQAPPVMVAGIGLVLLAFGLFYVWEFFPGNLLQDWRLTRSYPAIGDVVAAVPTGLRIQYLPVTRYEFRFRTDDGVMMQGVCYTTGRWWKAGDRVYVRYLREDPATCCIDGARLSETNRGSVLVLLFPAAGLSLVLWVARARRRVRWLLVNGRLAKAEVTGIKQTNMGLRRRVMHKVSLRCAEWPAPGIFTLLEYHPGVLELLRNRLETGRPVLLLYDPDRPGRAMLPEGL